MCLFVIMMIAAWVLRYIHLREDEYQGDIDPREDDYRDEINLREEEIDLIKADTYWPIRRRYWPQRRGNGLHCNTSANVCLLWASSSHVHLNFIISMITTMAMRRELTKIGKAYLRAMQIIMMPIFIQIWNNYENEKRTHRNREGIFESDGSEKHLEADEEVLVAGCHCSRLWWQQLWSMTMMIFNDGWLSHHQNG